MPREHANGMGSARDCGLFEIGWAIGLKYTDGFTRAWPSVGTGLRWSSASCCSASRCAASPWTAYAVWTGIGAVGTVLLGILLFNEPATAGRIACIVLIVTGILGLKLTHVA